MQTILCCYFFVLFVVIVCSFDQVFVPGLSRILITVLTFIPFASLPKWRKISMSTSFAQWPLKMPHRKVLRSNIRDTLQKVTTLLDWEKGANFLKGCPDEWINVPFVTFKTIIINFISYINCCILFLKWGFNSCCVVPSDGTKHPVLKFSFNVLTKPKLSHIHVPRVSNQKNS